MQQQLHRYSNIKEGSLSVFLYDLLRMTVISFRVHRHIFHPYSDLFYITRRIRLSKARAILTTSENLSYKFASFRVKLFLPKMFG